MKDLAALVAEGMVEGGGAVERLVLGTDDPAAIADAVSRWCQDHLGAPAAGGHLHAASVGCVLGVDLADGRPVALKAHPPRWRAPFLAAVHRAQAHLAAGGFPCPAPLVGPRPLLGALATAEADLPDPGARPGTEDQLATSAAGLADQVRRCRHLDPKGLSPHPLDAHGSALYPAPHSPLFDFPATEAGAEWIDDLAGRALVRRRRHEAEAVRVVAHTDWSCRNVRLDRSGVVAAYDWDSLALVPEAVAVGQAAMTWPAVGEVDRYPSPDEVDRYVAAYAAARGTPWAVAERDAARAAALYVLAYTARCEHSLGPVGTPPTGARSRLVTDGEALLDDA